MTSFTVAPAHSGTPLVRSPELARHHLGRIFSSGPLIIAAASLVLSLGTAIECGSNAHVPLLIYGLILWEWWGITAIAPPLSTSITLGRLFARERARAQLFCTAAIGCG